MPGIRRLAAEDAAGEPGRVAPRRQRRAARRARADQPPLPARHPDGGVRRLPAGQGPAAVVRVGADRRRQRPRPSTPTELAGLCHSLPLRRPRQPHPAEPDAGLADRRLPAGARAGLPRPPGRAAASTPPSAATAAPTSTPPAASSPPAIRSRSPGVALLGRRPTAESACRSGNDAVSVDRDGSRWPLVALRTARGDADRGAAPRPRRSRPDPRLVPAGLAAAAGPPGGLRCRAAGRPRGDGGERGGAPRHDAGHRRRAGRPDRARSRPTSSPCVALALVRGVLTWWYRRTLYTVAYDLEYDLRTIVHGHLTRMPFAFYDRVQSGQLISRANSDIRSVQMYLHLRPADRPQRRERRRRHRADAHDQRAAHPRGR